MISYILTSVALFHIGKREGVNAYGLAWVPGFQDYVLGGIADCKDAADGKPDRKFRIFMLICGILSVFIALCVIGIFAAFVAKVIRYMPEGNSWDFSGSLSFYYPGMDFSGMTVPGTSFDIEEFFNEFFMNPAFLAGISGLLTASVILAVLLSARTALKWVCLYKTYDLCKPSTVMVSLILSALFPGLIAAIVLFVKKNYRNDAPETVVYQR